MADNEISELVKASIQSKIIQAFKDTPEAIDDLVSACLTQEVTEYGEVPGYKASGKQKMPYLEYLARKTIQGVADAAVREYVKELEPKIRDEVKNSLQASDVTDAFVKSIVSATERDWSIRVEFNTNNS